MKKNSLIKTILNLSILAAIVPALTACTDEEIAATLGVAAVVGGTIALCSSDDIDCSSDYHDDYYYDRHRPRRDCGYRNVRTCVWKSRYGERRHRVCKYRRMYRCTDYRYDATLEELPGDQELPTLQPVVLTNGELTDGDKITDVALAKHYNISTDSATKFMSAMNDASKGGKEGLKALKLLGITDSDLSEMEKARLEKRLPVLSKESIKAIADSIEATASATGAMINDILVNAYKAGGKIVKAVKKSLKSETKVEDVKGINLLPVSK